MLPKFKLSQKLTLLVTMPLVFELLFVSILISLQHKVEAEADRLAKSRTIIATTNDLSKLVYDASILSLTTQLTVTTDQINDTPVTLVRSAVEDDVLHLRGLVSSNQDESRLVDKIDSNAHDALHFIEAISDAGRSSHDEIGKSAASLVRVKEFGSLNELVGASYKLIDSERGVQRLVPESELWWRRAILNWLWTGVLSIVSLTTILVLILNRQIASRLDRMVDNTIRMSRGEPLVARDPGNDEISRLDNSFHEMAQSLAAAEKEKSNVERLKAQFMLMITHDLRAPLNSIRLFLEMLANGTYGDISPKLEYKSKLCSGEAFRLMSMINNLLELDKLEAGKMVALKERTQIAPLIRQSLSSLENYAENRNVEILATCTESINADCDPQLLTELIVNLVANAIRFSPLGSSVSVDANVTEDWLEVIVSDRGPGISQKAQSGLFDRYARLDNQDQAEIGFGLGLAICKFIVDEHNGTIGVHSEVNKGSSFWFRIPVSAAALKAPAPPREKDGVADESKGD